MYTFFVGGNASPPGIVSSTEHESKGIHFSLSTSLEAAVLRPRQIMKSAAAASKKANIYSEKGNGKRRASVVWCVGRIHLEFHTCVFCFLRGWGSL